MNKNKKLNEIEVTNPYLSLDDEFYNRVKPSPLVQPHLIHANSKVAQQLGVDVAELKSDDFVKLLNGEFELKGADSFAMCYAGHQFGHFVPRLGDGRAINIGKVEAYQLQLKGAGETKYSRSGDGRAVLRSSIREYLMSEAMHHLHIPTTLCLGIIGSEHSVYREQNETGAIVCRVSSSWVRFGTFEYFAAHGELDKLKALTDYVIEESFPHLKAEEAPYAMLFREVMVKTARLMAQWMSVGFNHGVMNTDNMSIAGLTIDYGPFSFLDAFHNEYICNHTDRNGRYAYCNQPAIGKWNLQALMVAFRSLVPLEEMQEILAEYDLIYQRALYGYMAQKLGLETIRNEDGVLLREMYDMLEKLEVDYTLFLRTLSHFEYQGDRQPLLKLGLYHEPMNNWLNGYEERIKEIETQTRKTQMLNSNPKYVLKNYMLQEAIDAAEKGDFSVVDDLFKIAQAPFDEHEAFERWAGETPNAFKNQRLSCSS